MSRKTTRIYHGGPANTGSGGSGYPPAPDRLLDQAGTVLLQGITNVVHLLTGIDVEADTDMMITVAGDLMAFVTTDIYASADTIEMDAADQWYMYAVNEIVLAINAGGSLHFSLGGINSIWKVTGLKSGANQVGAGAIADEVYHCTTDHTLRIGV